MTAQEVRSYNMRNTDHSAGAMPVEASATPAQSYPSGPVFAAYRLPFPGVTGAREAGVCFDGEPAAGGATPPAGDPPPAPPPGNPPPAPPAPPATGDPADLGDAGKRALDAERARAKAAEDRAKAAEKERDELKAKGLTDSEKAIADATKAGADSVISRVHAQVRRSAVREALMTAGAVPSLVADLAKADEFAALKVNDDDEIDPKDLKDALAAHKARVPDAYKGNAGSADGGAGGSPPGPAKTMGEAISRHYQPSS